MKHYVVALVCLLLAAATTAEPLNTIIDLSHESPSPISSLEMENWHTFLKDAQPSSDHVESIDIKVIIQKIFDFYQIPVQAAECVTDLEGNTH